MAEHGNILMNAALLNAVGAKIAADAGDYEKLCEAVRMTYRLVIERFTETGLSDEGVLDSNYATIGVNFENLIISLALGHAFSAAVILVTIAREYEIFISDIKQTTEEPENV